MGAYLLTGSVIADSLTGMLVGLAGGTYVVRTHGR